LDPLAAAKVAGLSGDDQVLADVNELVDLGPHRLPLLEEHLPHTLHVLVAFVDSTPLTQVARAVVLDVRRRVAQSRIPVAPVEGRAHGLDDLHVLLLRHRPLSIPRTPARLESEPGPVS